MAPGEGMAGLPLYAGGYATTRKSSGRKLLKWERDVLEKEKRSQMDILHKQKEIEKWGAEKVKQMAHGN